MPLAVVPVPVLVKDKRFWVPPVVLLVRSAESRLILWPMEASVTV